MTPPRRRIEFDAAALTAQREHLGRASLYLDGITDAPLGSDWLLELVGPDGQLLELAAQVVHVAGSTVAFAFRDSSAPAMTRVAMWAEAGLAHGDGGGDGDGDGGGGGGRRREIAPIHERLRGLTTVQQLRIAREGEHQERVVLERLYGKAVWEALLRNPRITSPEVAHLAKMGALPRPMLELIIGNPAWLQAAPTRRALLIHPRMSAEQIDKVLRITPRNELKLIATQTAYPVAVRSAAKKLLGLGS